MRTHREIGQLCAHPRQIGYLLLDRSLELLEGRERRGVSGLDADDLAEDAAAAVEERELDRGREVRVADGRPLVQAALYLGLDAPHDAVVKRVLPRDALRHQHADGRVVVVERREPAARLDDVDAALQVLLGRGIVHTCSRARLVQLQLAHAI